MNVTWYFTRYSRWYESIIIYSIFISMFVNNYHEAGDTPCSYRPLARTVYCSMNGTWYFTRYSRWHERIIIYSIFISICSMNGTWYFTWYSRRHERIINYTKILIYSVFISMFVNNYHEAGDTPCGYRPRHRTVYCSMNVTWCSTMYSRWYKSTSLYTLYSFLCL